MKISVVLPVLTGVVGSFILTSAASADLVGLVYEKKDASSSGLDLFVTNIYAQFDDLGDRALSVGFADIVSSTGAFYQNMFGSDTAPSSAIVGAFPEAAFDSFVTFTAKTDDGWTSVDGDWDSSSFNNNGHLQGGWFNSNPDNGQGDPNDDGLVLLAQLSVEDAGPDGFIDGSMTVFWKSATGEILETQVDVFNAVPTPGAMALLGAAGLVGRRRRRA